MQPTLLQTKTVKTASNTSTETITFDSPVQAGSMILVVIFQLGGANDPSIALDSFGTDYVGITNCQPFTSLPNVFVDVLYALSPANSTGSNTITVLGFPSTGQAITLVAKEYCNFPAGFSWQAQVAKTNSFDVQNTGTGTSIFTNNDGFTNHYGSNLVLGVAINDGAQVFTVSAPFGNLTQGFNGSYQCMTADFAQSFINTPDMQASLPASANWGSALVSFFMDNPMFFVKGNVITAASSSASVSDTFGNPTNAGDLLYASVYANVGSPAISGWTQIATKVIHGTTSITTFSKLADGTETTITATSTSATVMKLHVYDIHGNANPIVLDGTPATAVTATNTGKVLESGPLSTTNPRTLVIGSYATNGDSTPISAEIVSGTDIVMFPMSTDTRMQDLFWFYTPEESNNPLVGRTFTANWGSNDYAASIFQAFDAAAPVIDPNSGSLGSQSIGS